MVNSRKCLICRRTIKQYQYMCPTDWRALPTETRRRLYVKDAQAMVRLSVLVDQLENGVPLDCIVVPA